MSILFERIQLYTTCYFQEIKIQICIQGKIGPPAARSSFSMRSRIESAA